MLKHNKWQKVSRHQELKLFWKVTQKHLLLWSLRLSVTTKYVVNHFLYLMKQYISHAIIIKLWKLTYLKITINITWFQKCITSLPRRSPKCSEHKNFNSYGPTTKICNSRSPNNKTGKRVLICENRPSTKRFLFIRVNIYDNLAPGVFFYCTTHL